MSSAIKPCVVIVGAGPAGLTAALELIRDGRARPIVLEASDVVGGISRTVEYKGNRMDIGGHRFFSKSDWVMNWWRGILPIAADAPQVQIAYQGQTTTVATDRAASEAGCVMLVRDRLSRIYFLRKYFDYPIKLNATTLANLGPVRLVRIGFSYAWSMLFPRRTIRSLEDFLSAASAANYTGLFSRTTRRRSGVCPAIASVPNGGRNESRDCLSSRHCAMPCDSAWVFGPVRIRPRLV